LGGVINYVINSEKWKTDPFFKTFAVTYTNAATIITEDFKDTEDMYGVFFPGCWKPRAT
jgi:formate dehydrogenase major subunit